MVSLSGGGGKQGGKSSWGSVKQGGICNWGG